MDFLVFFVLVFALFGAAPGTWKPAVLLAASLVFYGLYDWRILLLLVATVFLTHRLVLALNNSSSAARRRRFMAAAILVSVLFLAVFKYFVFFGDWMNRLTLFLGGRGFSVPALLLPAGISFYTFQLISYVVDVYRGAAAPQRSFAQLLLFITYFPKLVAGPIERSDHFFPLLKSARLPAAHVIHSGAVLAFWGLFKKLCIADNLSPMVDIALNPLVDPPAFAVSLAAFAFAVQIYADFSGYTDIARGVSRMMGVELTLNFNLPVLASNPAEIWRRWHITVGAFFRDYIYIPLGGSRAGSLRQALNIILVWLLGGLWHGASLGFLIWGIYCGLLIVAYNGLSNMIQRLCAGSPRTEKTMVIAGRVFTTATFAHGLLLFRVESPAHLMRVIEGVFSFSGTSVSTEYVLRIAVCILPLAVMQFLQAGKGQLEIWLDWSPKLQGAVLSAGLIMFFLFGSFRTEKFFYFQF